ncbi:MAG: pyridoxal phosphate-dependent aminotransferase [Chloroflexi bacterium]|nr:pyridoxal phosphate-dependent aminotransferase [Chloroflexota bacterium]MCC6895687.1 pyridoxal phosphate-dependent aminotransferase [Anaerolineae bacterium]
MVTQDYTQVNLDTPQFVVPPANRIPVNHYPAEMLAIPPSRMFLIRDALKKYKEVAGADAPTFDASQGDGGASLPGVPAEILQRAAEIQIKHGTAYDQPWGTPMFRKAAVEQYWKLDPATGWGEPNVCFVQGGRDGLQKAYGAMLALGNKETGDALVVSRVPWITYNWGPYMAGLNVLLAPGNPAEGWRYTSESIKATAEFAAKEGRKVAGIVITSPDNPTGRTIPVEEQIELARAALESGYAYVLFDWIYHWVTDGGPSDINMVLNAFPPEQRERLIFLDGITKSLGGSNVRSAHLVAGKKVIDYITSQASHGVVPAFYAQAVAIAAYEMGFGKAAASIIEPCRESRKILRRELAATGVKAIMGDGYYAFINCEPFIKAGGLADSEALMTYLSEQYGVAVVAGIYFSDAGKNWVRFSYALPPEKTEKAYRRMYEGLSNLGK